ncbi:MAG: 50S ribosomal protein L18 [Patescibacteria group bacterium]
MKNNKTSKKENLRTRRRARTRARIHGTALLPRLAVFRSNRFIYGQLIDDDKRVTLAAASDMGRKEKTKITRSRGAGKALAEAAKEKKIYKVVFDRGGFRYAGRISSFAEGAREGGLVF